MIEYLCTLHFTIFDIFLIFASQNAPLYLALTSVPTVRKGGSSKFTYILHKKHYFFSIYQYKNAILKHINTSFLNR